MNKSCIVLAVIFTFSQTALAEAIKSVPLPGESNKVVSTISTEEVNLHLDTKNKQKIEINEPIKELNTTLFNSKEEVVTHYLQAQKKLDIEDIKILWESTVHRNPVIKFALKKLALPADQRKVHSSRLAKTVSTLISGACILPSLLGADALTASATSAGGGLANRVIQKKSLPKEIPLTDTELIQLARLIEDLQDKVIKNYYSYKSNLKSYKTARENTIKNNRLYSKALQSNNMMKILTAKALNDKALNTEREIKQNIKLSRLQLERLAGAESVNLLCLGKIDIDLDEPIKVANISPDKDYVKNAMLKKKGFLEGKLEGSDSTVNILAGEISSELEEEKKELVADLQILWRAAVGKSETIRFAIIKLSNPEGEAVKTGTVKKILAPLASVAPVVGMGFSDPIAASSAMFGGGLLGSLLSDDSKINARLSKVTDTDLVMLAQETDALQEKLVILYCDYLNAVNNLDYISKIAEQNNEYLNNIVNKNSDLSCVANAFNEDIQDAKLKARQNVLNKRIALEQFVGNEAIMHVDKNIKNRLTFNY